MKFILEEKKFAEELLKQLRRFTMQVPINKAAYSV